MKKTVFASLNLLLIVLIIALVPTEREADIYKDTVRLHILAESNTDADQELKLLLRDEILSRFGEELSGYQSVSSAKDGLSSMLFEIEEFSESFVKKKGFDYDVSATLGEEWYETRSYDGFTLPKGYYSSLKVTIGKGEGQNWWCVLYPPLCLDFATSNAYTDSEEGLILGKYTVKFKILEFLSEACR